MIGMEALNNLLKCAVEGNFLSNSKVATRGGEGETISHLLYVDDMISAQIVLF